MSSPYIIQQPKQARSQETMNHILDTAAAILEHKTFDQLTVNEVVQQAGTSVGAFYGRFRDKEALLQALDARFFNRFESDFEAVQQEHDWENQPVSAIVHDVARFLVEVYQRDIGVLRSLNLKARLYGDSQFRQREQDAWDRMFPRLQRLLLKDPGAILHPDPKAATRFGFQVMFFSLREFVLWEPLREGARPGAGPNAGPGSRLPAGLAAESARVFLAYLGVKES